MPHFFSWQLFPLLMLVVDADKGTNRKRPNIENKVEVWTVHKTAAAVAAVTKSYVSFPILSQTKLPQHTREGVETGKLDLYFGKMFLKEKTPTLLMPPLTRILCRFELLKQVFAIVSPRNGQHSWSERSGMTLYIHSAAIFAKCVIFCSFQCALPTAEKPSLFSVRCVYGDSKMSSHRSSY